MLAEQLVWATPSLNACLEIVFLLSLASFYSMEKSVAPHEPFLIATGAETPRQRQQTLADLPELEWFGAELVDDTCTCGNCAECTQRVALKKGKLRSGRPDIVRGRERRATSASRRRTRRRGRRSARGRERRATTASRRRTRRRGRRSARRTRHSGRTTSPAESSSNCSPTPRAQGLPRTHGFSSTSRWEPPSTRASRGRSSVTSKILLRFTLTRTHVVVASFSKRTSSRCECAVRAAHATHKASTR